jgi:hypothetical protein
VSCFEYEVSLANLAWPCLSDVQEPNDSLDAAVPLVRTTGLTTGYGDADWYWIDVAPGDELRVDASNGLYADVYDATGAFLGFADFGVANDEATTQRFYVLLVDGYSSCETYDLDYVVR